MTRLRSSVPAAVAVLLAACGGGSSGGPSPSGTGSKLPAALVQVENGPDSRPQWGLRPAGVVYEYVTEGGISRFSVLYTQPPPSRIGPVRSARLVTIHLAKLYGAVIVYSGASAAVQRALQSSGVPRVDENSAKGALYRTGDRRAPHNLVTDGQRLASLLPSFEGKAPPAPALWHRTSTAPAGGREVARFTVPVASSETPAFTWDATAHGWRRAEADGSPFLDAGSRTPVVVPTVIVQQVRITDTGEVEDVNGAHGVDIDITGTGSAQVFTGGQEYDATWSQPASGPPAFTLATGGAAPIAPGVVWICLVPAGSAASLG